MRNQVQLITYVDRLAGSLPGLVRMLESGPLAGLFGGVHLLPFFHPFDGVDAGFDPIDHRAVDTRLGGWDDVAAIAKTHDVLADLIVNHVSASSEWFQDVVAHGDESPHAGMFLTFDRIYPGADEQELLRIYRPRPGLPFTTMRLGKERRLVWTTFTDQQIDLDVRSPQALGYLNEVLRQLADGGVTMVRVDAAGYAVKTPGTSSFMTSDTYAFLGELAGWATELRLEVLLEVHSHYLQQIEIAKHVDRVYDFGLPPLVLYALHSGDAEPLLGWLKIRPVNCVTVLDTHDGIGVIDAGADAGDPTKLGLLTPGQIDHLVESVHDASGGSSRKATGAAANNVDLYQVNCTFYDALGAKDEPYLLARLIQFFAPGIPQVYYVGLFAGRNDLDLLSRSGVGRDVNRRHYTEVEVSTELQRPVVQALTSLIRWRNAHPAFDGEFDCGTEADTLWMRWTAGAHEARLDAHVADATWKVTWTDADPGAQAIREAVSPAVPTLTP